MSISDCHYIKCRHLSWTEQSGNGRPLECDRYVCLRLGFGIQFVSLWLFCCCQQPFLAWSANCHPVVGFFLRSANTSFYEDPDDVRHFRSSRLAPFDPLGPRCFAVARMPFWRGVRAAKRNNLNTILRLFLPIPFPSSGKPS